MTKTLDLIVPDWKGDDGFYAPEFDKKNAVPFSWLTGKTIESIYGLKRGSNVVVFTTTEGDNYVLFHDQDCCESVEVWDVCGDVGDLIGTPILKAEEESDTYPEEELKEYPASDESSTWTFYKLATQKGYVDIRWFGTSNGYYSERVDTYLLTAADKAAQLAQARKEQQEQQNGLEKKLEAARITAQKWQYAYTSMQTGFDNFLKEYIKILDELVTMDGVPDQAVLRLNEARRAMKKSRQWLSEHLGDIEVKWKD